MFLLALYIYSGGAIPVHSKTKVFTGIVEACGIVEELIPEQGNLHLWIKAPFVNELKIDQSVAHNGACLTVTEINGDRYRVTVIRESLDKTMLGSLEKGDMINLERCMKLGDRLDGHIVQGHVDTYGICTDVMEDQGSWRFRFSHQQDDHFLTVAKGSVCVNGVSLTVVDSARDSFSVAVIPYTYENTNFSSLKAGDKVNLEFDIIGKYLAVITKGYQ